MPAGLTCHLTPAWRGHGAGSGAPEFTVAGVASAIAVACSELADPCWRGQEATSPAAGELRMGERVVAGHVGRISRAAQAGQSPA
ncbi:hypothetical protein [Janthinobacterium aquaticum]|uniref:hypothetical protein n=1 Tax=Janthinobacterium sp. FT58W TaxID=2654254 RepID=UPI00126585AB|nr:hypothetical protein [Janthinobacterium sp. FT58W]KAB8043424.1 hypothetical protein GCM43_08900 [Janthinobacterium sp. FT58W]